MDRNWYGQMTFASKPKYSTIRDSPRDSTHQRPALKGSNFKNFGEPAPFTSNSELVSQCQDFGVETYLAVAPLTVI